MKVRMSLICLGGVVCTTSATPAINFKCDPCLDRSGYSVKAIVHGTSTDPFWTQAKTAAVRAASDMNIKFEMNLYDTFDLERMANDVKAVASGTAPSTLMVTIPNEDVANAVKAVVDKNIPVVGFNTGATFGQSVGVSDFIAPDDVQGGKLAAQTMKNLNPSLTKALFVDDEAGNQATIDRRTGFETELGTSVTVEVLTVVGTDEAGTRSAISEKLAGCPYGAVLLSGTRSVTSALLAYQDHSCSITTSPLGAFDTTPDIYSAIGSDKMSFTISNQQYLQGALTTVLASLVATTGKSLAASGYSFDGSYLTGPNMISKFTLPTDTYRICEAEAFPVCQETETRRRLADSTCPCRKRKQIKIGGVTHGITTDSFWDPVYEASKQAALDMGVTLLNERFEPETDEQVLHTKMANRITRLCEMEAVDGIFVSIPSDIPKLAIQTCLNLDIPVVSINAGLATSQSMGLAHHIGMLEYNAGKAAGNFLQKSGITQGFCINHAPGVNVVLERCNGVKDSLEINGLMYIGQVFVPSNNAKIYISNVENFVNETGDWDGIGIIAAGGPQHIPVIQLAGRHNKAKIGSFDLSEELYEAVDAGVKEFGMDQQPYLQGYMPVVLLAYAATVKQVIANQVIESGPAFIQSSPSDEEKVCEKNMFVTCDEKADSLLAGHDDEDDKMSLIVGISVVAGVLLISVIFLVYRLNALHHHLEKLKSQGKQVPDLSVAQRLSTMVKPVNTVVQSGKGAENAVSA